MATFLDCSSVNAETLYFSEDFFAAVAKRAKDSFLFTLSLITILEERFRSFTVKVSVGEEKNHAFDKIFMTVPQAGMSVFRFHQIAVSGVRRLFGSGQVSESTISTKHKKLSLFLNYLGS